MGGLRFQSTLSVRRATQRLDPIQSRADISIHALREESDHLTTRPLPTRIISIHALREESDQRIWRSGWCKRISIHALREESDLSMSRTLGFLPISIHALREESDSRSISQKPGSSAFQSTLSVRRATRLTFRMRGAGRFQSTLSVRRATPHLVSSGSLCDISIHALREESDAIPLCKICPITHFNPRSP